MALVYDLHEWFVDAFLLFFLSSKSQRQTLMAIVVVKFPGFIHFRVFCRRWTPYRCLIFFQLFDFGFFLVLLKLEIEKIGWFIDHYKQNVTSLLWCRSLKHWKHRFHTEQRLASYDEIIIKYRADLARIFARLQIGWVGVFLSLLHQARWLHKI